MNNKPPTKFCLDTRKKSTNIFIYVNEMAMKYSGGQCRRKSRTQGGTPTKTEKCDSE